MKKSGLFFLVIAFLCLSTSAFAELNVDDLEKIQQLLDKLEDRIDKRFTDFEKHLSEDIQDLDKHLSGNIQTLDKNFGERLSFHSSLIIALIIAIIGFVSVPMGFITIGINLRKYLCYCEHF